MVGSRKVEPDLNVSFQELLEAIGKANPTDEALYEAFAPVRKRIWRRWCIRWLFGVVCLIAICLAVYYSSWLNWQLTAIGRLVMIELLPYWDWTPLYRDKCLIAKVKSETAVSKKYEPIALQPDDCVVCRSFATVPVRKNVTYEALYRYHLMRNMPIIVSDAQLPWHKHPRYGSDWEGFLLDLEELLLETPCDFRTNLLFKPNTAKASALARMVDLIASNTSTYDSARGWFVQFRNCGLRTVKKTRTMFEKPYFYASHWDAPYTNWMLLSSAFQPRRAPEQTPNMAGLVIVQQMRSRLGVMLRPRAECENSCQELSLTLHEQQSLLFSTSLWNFSYLPSDGNDTSITFVTESYESV